MGFVKIGDYEKLVDRYLRLGHIEGLQAKQINRKILSIWEEFFARAAPNGAIDSDSWVVAVRRFPVFSLFRVIVEFMNMWFDLIDTNGDGVIQKEEFAFFLNAFRVENETDISAAFQALDTDGDGQIDHNEFIDAGLEFWMTDEDKPSKLLFGPLI